jgi:hypothetical protein
MTIADDDDADTDEMEAYLDELPEDALDLEIDEDAEDLELLDTDEAQLNEIELNDAVELASGDDGLELTEDTDPRGPDPALPDTVPTMTKDALFEEPGTDLSSLDDGDPEETS